VEDECKDSIELQDPQTTANDAPQQHDDSLASSTKELTTNSVPQDGTSQVNQTHQPAHVQKSVEHSSSENQPGPGKEPEAPREEHYVEEHQTAIEKPQSPGENDSGVNVEDVHNDETAISGENLIKITPPDDEVTSSPSDGIVNDEVTSSLSKQPSSRQQHHDDGSERLSARKSPNLGERRRSLVDVRDPKYLPQRGAEEDVNKPRLVALAQKGEWSVLDQVLRAMERSSFYEVNLPDEVCKTAMPVGIYCLQMC